MHLAIIGKPVFYAKNYHDLLALNKSCKLNFDNKIYNKLSYYG